MTTLRFVAQLFWCLMWDACFYLLYKPCLLLTRLSHHLCNYCYRMVNKIEAEEVIAILSRPAKGD